MDALKLLALDTEDLAVISAQVQDAVTKPELLEYDPKAKRFTMVLNRFAWDAQGRKKNDKGFERRRAILSFANVLSVQTLDVKRTDAGQVLSVLTVRFIPDQSPSGRYEIVFSGGPMIRLHAEVLEVQLQDLGSAWETKFKPRHPLA